MRRTINAPSDGTVWRFPLIAVWAVGHHEWTRLTTSCLALRVKACQQDRLMARSRCGYRKPSAHDLRSFCRRYHEARLIPASSQGLIAASVAFRSSIRGRPTLGVRVPCMGGGCWLGWRNIPRSLAAPPFREGFAALVDTLGHVLSANTSARAVFPFPRPATPEDAGSFRFPLASSMSLYLSRIAMRQY